MGSIVAWQQQSWAPKRLACTHTCVCQAISYPTCPSQLQCPPQNNVRYLRWPQPGGRGLRSVATSVYSSSDAASLQHPGQSSPKGPPDGGLAGRIDAEQLRSMMATGEFELGGNVFTFQSARAYISTRLRAYAEGQRVSVLDEDLLLHLIKFHPKYTEKVGQAGISHFSVQTSQQGTVCFFLHRNDGTSSDFSFLKCLATYAYMHITRQVDAMGSPTAPVPELPAVNWGSKTSRDRRPARRGRHRTSIPEEMLQALDADLDPLQGAPAVGPAAEGRAGPGPGPGYTQQPWQQQQQGQPGLQQGHSLQQDVWSRSDDWATSSLDELASASWDSTTASGPSDGFGSGYARPLAGAGRRHATQATPGYARQPQLQQQQQQTWHEQPRQSVDNQLSWKECMLALRAAVVPQLRQFKARSLATGQLVCQETGQLLTADTAVVAYQPPQEFKHLVVAWMKQAGIASRGQLVIDYVGEQGRPIMQDAGQVASWQHYHSQYARLLTVGRSQQAAQ